MFSFICDPCKQGADLKAKKGSLNNMVKASRHRQCKGSTWCDCQHRVKI